MHACRVCSLPPWWQLAWIRSLVSGHWGFVLNAVTEPRALFLASSGNWPRLGSGPPEQRLVKGGAALP